MDKPVWHQGTPWGVHHVNEAPQRSEDSEVRAELSAYVAAVREVGEGIDDVVVACEAGEGPDDDQRNDTVGPRRHLLSPNHQSLG